MRYLMESSIIQSALPTHALQKLAVELLTVHCSFLPLILLILCSPPLMTDTTQMQRGQCVLVDTDRVCPCSCEYFSY